MKTRNMLTAALTCALAFTIAPRATAASPAERIAIFDNDGTLWSEQPMDFQAFFIFDRIRALAPQHPEWQTPSHPPA